MPEVPQGPITHRSDRKKFQEEAAQARREIAAYEIALADSQSKSSGSAPVLKGKDKDKKGGRVLVQGRFHHESSQWMWKGARWWLKDLRAHREDGSGAGPIRGRADPVRGRGRADP